MPILWEPTLLPGPEFSFQRPYQDWVGAAWFNVSYVQFDQDFLILKENVLGGYTMHFAWRRGMFAWSSKTCKAKDLWTDVYLLAPGGTTPMDGGAWTVQFRNVVGFANPCMYLFPAVNDGILHHRELPRGPSSYWAGEFPVISPP